jgi:vancomycin resistance protein YoaR
MRTRPGRLRRLRGIALALGAVAAITAALAAAARAWLPADGLVAQGLIVDGIPAGREERIDALVAARVAARLGTRVGLRHEGAMVLETTLAELGAHIDAARAVAAVASVGRAGAWWERALEAWRARKAALAVALPWTLPAEPLAERLRGIKEGIDRRPEPARWDFTREAAVTDRPGATVDVYAALEALERAARAGGGVVELPVRYAAARATAALLGAIDRSALVSRYATRFAFAGGQASRAGNISRAAAAVDGTVLMPGEVVSFNQIVGPRSSDNGFGPAGEIYRGEMRMGIGGGTCQVASTLHAAVYLGGLDVVERSPHSRPSGYIPMGLDATVVYPHVDLKLRNPFPFPVVVRAVVAQGEIAFELRGAERPAEVETRSARVGVRPFTRKIRETALLGEGRFVQKQKGLRGIVLRKQRHIRLRAGGERLEETTDVYPPTAEIFLVGPGVDPARDLPPLAPDVTVESEPG